MHRRKSTIARALMAAADLMDIGCNKESTAEASHINAILVKALQASLLCQRGGTAYVAPSSNIVLTSCSHQCANQSTPACPRRIALPQRTRAAAGRGKAEVLVLNCRPGSAASGSAPLAERQAALRGSNEWARQGHRLAR